MSKQDLAEAKHTADLFDIIAPHLAGQPPAVQGAVLAQCLAAWLGGHRPELRDELLRLHIDAVQRLTPIMAAALRREPDMKPEHKQ